MSQIRSGSVPLTVSLSPPSSGADWLASLNGETLSDTSDLVEWIVGRTDVAYQVLAPFQVYGLTTGSLIVEGPLFGSTNIESDPGDPYEIGIIRVHKHIPGVIAYWVVPAGIVGTPDIRVRTVRQEHQP